MESIEITFKIIEIIIATIGLILVIFGWIIPYRNSLRIERLRQKNEQELERIRWKKEFVDKQISDLYGPLYSLIIESNISFSRILYQLGRKHVIPKDKSFYDLPEHEQKIWKHYVDNYKIKSQMKMVEIMRNNFHLIYKSDVPLCYRKFLDYSLGWELLNNQRCHGVPNYYEYHYAYNYPVQFNKYVRETLDQLLKEQARLIEQTEDTMNSTNINNLQM